MNLLRETVDRIGALDADAMRLAAERQNSLTKPSGALGVLEDISIKLAGVTGSARPIIGRKVVVVMAGDHGVAAEGVSAYPQEVTAQMLANFSAGGAAINVLARHVGADVVVVDVGVASDSTAPGVFSRRVRRGTGNIAVEPAMSREEAEDAVGAGIEVALGEIAGGATLVATGDMGIANSTAATAVLAALTGLPVRPLVGRGTGIEDGVVSHKAEVIERAIRVNAPDPSDPIDVLAKVGGLEIGAIAGVILGCAARRVPVVVDGFISGAGALLAAGICPLARDYMIASHVSVEPGHEVMLERLGLKPMLRMDMRLGEGTGAVLGMTLVEAAAKVLDEMATFGEAGVAHAV